MCVTSCPNKIYAEIMKQPAWLLAAALFAASAWAQPHPQFFGPLAQVQDFLQLSDSQVQVILGHNEEFGRWSAEKQSRIWQVQAEIAEETRKDPLDPGALGIRYAEIEAICREVRAKGDELLARNGEVLSQDQKAKLGVLEEALKLAPVIVEAQSVSLLGAGQVPLGFSTRIVGSVIGGAFGAPPAGCAPPLPVVRPAGRIVRGPVPGGRWFDAPAFLP